MKPSTLTVYLRREPTTDPVWHRYGGNGKPPRDVAVYRDMDASKPFARIPWHAARKPHKRQKGITLNCYRWHVQWLPDLTTNATAA